MAPQICAAGGGGGGIPADAPGNQDVEGSGSADRMVISGRLRTGSHEPFNNLIATTNNSRGTVVVVNVV